MQVPEPIRGRPFTGSDPLFTVIVADYEGSVSRDFFRRKMACLAAQTCKDFEVLVYHDGPKSSSYEADLEDGPRHADTRFVITPERAGDWGHSLRDLGLRQARGRWIIHTNADNLFFPTLIETLKAAALDRRPRAYAVLPKSYPAAVRWLARWLDVRWQVGFLTPKIYFSAEPQILIYAVVMRGMISARSGWTIRHPPVADSQGVVLSGFPVKPNMIDAMQLVMRRDLWLAEGGWSDRSMNSDGVLYDRFARTYRTLSVPVILGEHW